ncbi:MAG TPA: hypothetical protein VIL74_08880 [Pyrinomonadaceae bacterium]
MEPLARNLAAAFISYQTGVSMAQTVKNLADQPVGEFWHVLAEELLKGLYADLYANNTNKGENQNDTGIAS